MTSTVLLCLLLGAAEPLFEEPFSEPDALERFHAVHRVENFTRVADPDDPENTALRVDVPGGGHYGGALTVTTRDILDKEPDRLYLRYRLRIGEDWTTSSTGKLPGFGGTYGRAGWGGRPSDGTNGWSARGMFGGLDDDARVPVGSYVYHADMVDQERRYGSGLWWDITLERGRWYTIEQEIRLNSVFVPDDAPGRGAHDGVLRAWVDGELVFERTDLHLRDTTELRVECAWLNVYHGGKTPAPADMHLLIDDVFVALERP